MAKSQPSVINKLIPVGVECFLIQLLETGFFHADPHPGNLLVTPDGKLALIDFGLMADVPIQDTKTMTKTIVHLMQGKDCRTYLLYFIFIGKKFIWEKVVEKQVKRKLTIHTQTTIDFININMNNLGDVPGLVQDAIELGFLPQVNIHIASYHPKYMNSNALKVFSFQDVDKSSLTPVLQKVFDSAQLAVSDQVKSGLTYKAIQVQ